MSDLSGSGTLRGVIRRGGGGSPQDVYWDDILDKPDFAAVATSGSYNDLLDKPPAPSVMIGATAQSNGAAGYVSQPLAGDQNKFLNGAGEWVAPQSSGDNYSTTEQVVGTWIDGTPVYRKVIEFSSTQTFNHSSDKDITSLANFSDLRLPISCEGIFDGTSEEQTTPISMYKYNNKIYARTYIDIALNKFILVYTKTTDTIGG